MFQPLNRSYALGFHPYSVEYIGAFKLTSNDIKCTILATQWSASSNFKLVVGRYIAGLHGNTNKADKLIIQLYIYIA